MEQKTFQQLEKEKKIEIVEESSPRTNDQQQQENKLPEFDLSALTEELKSVRRPVSSAPTYVPKNFLQQFVLYENGATRRLYIYLNGGWYYATLT